MKFFSLFILALFLFLLPLPSVALDCPELILLSDPIHLGDTWNDEWMICTPDVPPDPYGECFTIYFDLSSGQADSLAVLLIKSSGASTDTTAKVFIDNEFLGYLAEANIGTRCDFHQSWFSVMLAPGEHEIQICTSLYPYQHGTELDDYAFFDLRLSCAVPVALENVTWGHIKSIYK